GWMGQDRAIQSDDIVAVAYRHLPPILFEIIFEFSPKWSVIPHPVESAINLARLENESAPLAQANDLLHPLRVLFPDHDRTYLTADHADETDFSINILSLIPVLLSLRPATPFRTSGGLPIATLLWRDNWTNDPPPPNDSRSLAHLTCFADL